MRPTVSTCATASSTAPDEVAHHPAQLAAWLATWGVEDSTDADVDVPLDCASAARTGNAGVVQTTERCVPVVVRRLEIGCFVTRRPPTG
jgi:hypothetical protein